MKWSEYYKITKTFPHSPLLDVVEISVKQESELMALDLGSGSGRDINKLLSFSQRVVAVDDEANAIKELKQKYHNEGRLMIHEGRIQNFIFKRVNIINASHSLFFLRREDFFAVWENIKNSLVGGGLFSGHFLGMRDSWSKGHSKTCLSEHELMGLLENASIIYFDELEFDNQRGKHWHVYEVVIKFS